MTSTLPEALIGVRDAVRSGRSLRQALQRGCVEGSPLSVLAPYLRMRRSLSAVLRTAATEFEQSDLSTACLVLSVQASAGGDPAPALTALAERVSERESARMEARAMTTQSRMSARTMLFLTPGFFALLAFSDPTGMRAAVAGPGRIAIVAGVILQMLGAYWMTRIIAAAGRDESETSRWTAVPGVRAVAKILTGSTRKADPLTAQVASACDVCALVLDSGLSPTRALALVGGPTSGVFGEAVARAVAEIRAGAGAIAALRKSLDLLEHPAARRFAECFAASAELGVPLAPMLRSLGQDLWRIQVVTLSEEIRKASVRVLFPLGLLILPAFVLTCLVPLMVGGLKGLS